MNAYLLEQTEHKKRHTAPQAESVPLARIDRSDQVHCAILQGAK